MPVMPYPGGRLAPQGEISDGLFEKYLTETIPHSQLEKAESLYHKPTDDDKLRQKLKYEYAQCLIRSRYTADIQRGVILMEDLCTNHPNEDLEYFFFLSLGHARLKNYPASLKFLKTFIDGQPGDARILAWREFIKDKMKRDTKVAVALVAGSALVVGGLIGIGLTLLKLRR